MTWNSFSTPTPQFIFESHNLVFIENINKIVICVIKTYFHWFVNFNLIIFIIIIIF